MTESDAQSYVGMEDFSGLTDGNKVDEGALPGQGLHVPVILVLHVSVMHVTYTYISRISNGTGEIWVKQLDRSVFILSGCLIYGNLDKKF